MIGTKNIVSKRIVILQGKIISTTQMARSRNCLADLVLTVSTEDLNY